MNSVRLWTIRMGVLSWGLCFAAVAPARTIELTYADCDRMAVIGPQAPRASWLMQEVDIENGEYSTFYINLRPDRAVLIRFPLDRIPAGQRITRAEWVIPIVTVYPAISQEQRLYVRRIIGDWGRGACYQYRTVFPKPVAWTAPGATGASTDRVAEPTGIGRFTEVGDITINVTEDVELWYTGAVENQGWTLNLEGGEAPLIRVVSPFWNERTPEKLLEYIEQTQGASRRPERELMKLRITYEPE